jgi:hypothetical protein
MKATCIIHAPNGPVPSCHDHAEKAKRVFAFIGCYVAVTPFLTDEECTNCLNEAVLSVQAVEPETESTYSP